MVRNKQLKEQLRILDQLIAEYKESKEKSQRDFWKYEQKYMKRLREAIRFFQELVPKAVALTNFNEQNKMGRPEKLSLEQRVKIILIQRIMQKSNREISQMLEIFSYLQDVDISYKTIERLYDDERIQVILFNMNTLIRDELDIRSVNSSGDGTGYLLSVKEHYASAAQKLKEKGKKNDSKRKTFFSFTLMDIQTRIYIAFGTSYRSEKDAYNKAIEMLKITNVDLDSIRLDRYYSGKNLVKFLSQKYQGIKCYLIPKKNAIVKGSPAWKKMLDEFCNNINNYLTEYFKRNNSESGFSEDKRRFGWRIPQRIEERVNSAYHTIFTWHNLFWVGQ
ncbi:MAG: ISNCY family transposase [Candidatus Woesearchaeota archaeon]